MKETIFHKLAFNGYDFVVTEDENEVRIGMFSHFKGSTWPELLEFQKALRALNDAMQDIARASMKKSP